MGGHNRLSLQILQQEDISPLIETFNFPWGPFKAAQEKWAKYYTEQKANARIVCIAKIEEEFVGYVSLLRLSEYANFKDRDIPEICDLWVSEQHRGNGIGSKLIKYMEKIAQEEGYTQIGIGVGLYKDYGHAQRLYVYLRYVPDGVGVTYNNQPVVLGESYLMDRELALWLTKRLI